MRAFDLRRTISMNRRIVTFILVFITLALFPQFFTRPVILGIAILILLYAVLGQAWNILGGYAGQVSLGNAVYFGVGAYTSTWLFTNWHITPWIGMLVGVVLAVIVGLIIGFPTFRLTGHYFVTATIVINEVIRVIFNNWDFVGGARGLYVPILEESLLNFQFHSSKVPYYYLIAALFIILLLVTWFIESGKLGYYFRAIREDMVAASALGVNPYYYKHVANAINAAFTALAGTFYAQYVLFLDPASVFSIWISVLVLLVPVLGGRGTLWGPMLGALVLIPLSEITRIYLGGEGRALHLLVYGFLIMVISILEPHGLVSLIQKLPFLRSGYGGAKSDSTESNRSDQNIRRADSQP
jgi:branched-chain amino acid transport system permease protein